ncbi:MAG: methylmalonyl-CoA mutase [Lautropia sp.]
MSDATDDENSGSAFARAVAAWSDSRQAEFAAERQPSFESSSGIEIQRAYTPLDLASRGVDPLAGIGLPGEFPYTRGIHAGGYRKTLWGIQQYAGHPTPEMSNRLWKTQVDAGATHLLIAYDLPSQLGYDPDARQAEGEVGRVGTSMSSFADWQIGFDGIPVKGLYVGQTYNAPAAIGLANYLCIAEQQGVPRRELRGNLQNDLLKEYQARGLYVFPPAASLRLATDIAAYTAEHMPQFNGIDICTYHHAECGATPVHEAAIGLANVIAYYQHVIERGMTVDEVAPTVRFLVACDHVAFFENICKVRAMRRIYARIMRDRFHAKRPESLQMRNYSGKGGSTLYREQYLNNIARCTLAGLSAVFSGSQSIGIRSYDEAFGIASEDAILTSTRVQQILAYETGIPDTVDPLAGSYFIESLTSDMEQAILAELDKIEARGGALQCTVDGYIRNLLMQDGYARQRSIERGDTVIVGVNRFRSEGAEDRPTKVYRTDPSIEVERVEAVRRMRARRDNGKVARCLDALKGLALEPPSRSNNMMPAIIEATRSYCTVGEITGLLREVWGEHQGFRL